MLKSDSLKQSIKYLLFAVAFIAAVLFVTAFAKADAVDYLSNNYEGTVDSDTTMYTQPGTVNAKMLKADGSELKLTAGTKLFITNEQYDPDMDIWYECTVTVDGQEYKGYVYTGKVTRGNAVAFTPTPIPTEAPDAEITDAAPEITSDPVITPVQQEDTTQQMIDDSKTFAPWKWIIILLIVIVVFMIVYTIYVKQSEEKLTREIERCTSHHQYEPIEGESDEDYEEAKSNYYDSIGLGDQDGKDLGEIIGNPDDVHLDMTGIFDDEQPEEEEEPLYYSNRADDDSTLDELIASLENRLGGKEAVDASVENYSFNEDMEETAEDIPEEVPAEPVRRPARPSSASARPSASGLLDKLNALEEGDKIAHRVYGRGVVVDNSDDEIIQVKFGDDMRFLKKEKLVAKNLVKVL